MLANLGATMPGLVLEISNGVVMGRFVILCMEASKSFVGFISSKLVTYPERLGKAFKIAADHWKLAAVPRPA